MEEKPQKNMGFVKLLLSQGIIKIIASFLAGALVSSFVILLTPSSFFTGKVIQPETDSLKDLQDIKEQIIILEESFETLKERIEKLEKNLIKENTE